MLTILYIGLAMAFGLLFNRIMKIFNLPNVTGYLLAGLLIGPHVLNLLPSDYVEELSVLSEIALGFIAFSIGAEFRVADIKKIGKSVLVITFFQALIAAFVVTVAIWACGFDLPLALTLGAIATATAPAATLLVVRQYNARGPVTNILLPVVALDDAIGLILFSIMLSISQVLAKGTALTFEAMVLEPLKEIGLSLAIGFGLGLAMTFAIRFFKSRANRTTVIICFILIGTALADLLDLSSLLLCMMISAVFVNLSKDSAPVMECCDRWTPPLFLIFFVISGAELDISVLPTVGILGVIYLLSRSAGKYFGAWLGSTVVHEDHNIRKYLGFTLLPQAGVAIGMSLIVAEKFAEYGKEIRAVVLAATLVYELIGPLLTKIALSKAGEIPKVPKPAKAAK